MQNKPNKPKEFLLLHHDKMREAVELGYDIRMDEEELLRWMEYYAQDQTQYLIRDLTFIQAELQKYFPDTSMLNRLVTEILELYKPIPF